MPNWRGRERERERERFQEPLRKLDRNEVVGAVGARLRYGGGRGKVRVMRGLMTRFWLNKVDQKRNPSAHLPEVVPLSQFTCLPLRPSRAGSLSGRRQRAAHCLRQP
jgi:hypothetical protein